MSDESAATPAGAQGRPNPADAGRALRPLGQRLARAAGVSPAPPDSWLRTAIAHFVETCLRAGWTAPGAAGETVERLLRAITEPLDRGLLLLDADGTLVA